MDGDLNAGFKCMVKGVDAIRRQEENTLIVFKDSKESCQMGAVSAELRAWICYDKPVTKEFLRR